MNKNILFFILGIVFTFSFITLLQFFSGFAFVRCLILMHVGIFFFILSKRGFKKQGMDVSKYYKREYICLFPYLAIMLYKILTTLKIVPMMEPLKITVSLTITVIAVLVSIFNVRELLHTNSHTI